MRTINVNVDVTAVVAFGEQLTVAATVCLPDTIPDKPIVCFAWPGGGYSRRYFTFDMPGDSGGGQAGWHTDRGWIFIAVDTLNTGDSSKPADPSLLTFENLAASNHYVVKEILSALTGGTISDGVGPIDNSVTVALGQSLGGSLVVLTQGQFSTFDAVAVLGFSSRHTMIWAPPQKVSGRRVYLPRGTNIAALTEDVFVAAMPEMAFDDRGWPLCAAGFHLDDVPESIVAADMLNYPARPQGMPEWGSATIPPCAMTMMSPGAIAPEAASITVPVFIGAGELDTIPDLKSEPAGYPQSKDITLFECAGMAHMHNFAGTREVMWTRFYSWAEGVASLRAATRARESGRV